MNEFWHGTSPSSATSWLVRLIWRHDVIVGNLRPPASGAARSGADSRGLAIAVGIFSLPLHARLTVLSVRFGRRLVGAGWSGSPQCACPR
jgi:hypothetical protein